MWTADVTDLNSLTKRVVLRRAGAVASYADVIDGWRGDPAFRAFFGGVLASLPFASFRWETPGLTAASMTGEFECAAIDTPALEKPPDERAFSQQFRKATESILTFPSLGSDADLVVPRPEGDKEAYAHLAAFLRRAPERQRDTLWQVLGNLLARRVGPRPIWVSTSGLGVAWLHVRVDQRPKYYAWAPYKAGA